jgi:hypothetical protein
MELGGYFKVDCQQLLLFFIIIVIIIIAPQGDALQKGTEVSHCIAPCFYRRIEVQGILYHKVLSCNVSLWN